MRSEFLPYCRPSVDHADIYAVVDALNNGWLTTGPKVAQFEAAFAERSGVKHAIALNSCTAGLHLAMIALGIGPGDEIVMPSLTFVAGALCALHVGAKPVFCDVDPKTLCASAETIAAVTTERTRLIISMGFAGRPAGIESILAFADSRGIPVIEDAALNAGTLDNGAWAGARSKAAVYSFYATKNINTAEGGMFLTNDDELARKVRALSLHGMTRDAWRRYQQGGTWRYDIVVEGHKYNMPDISAALGIMQLARLDAMQIRRMELARYYISALRELPGLTPAATAGMRSTDRHSWAFFPILVDRAELGVSRDEIIELLASENIGTSVHYIPTHHFTLFRDYEHGDLSTTDAIFEQIMSLPLYPSMSLSDVDDVLIALKRSVMRSRSIAL
jgi:dTDP-4-amino-4,6-dideoxygalactose transaminase